MGRGVHRARGIAVERLREGEGKKLTAAWVVKGVEEGRSTAWKSVMQ